MKKIMEFCKKHESIDARFRVKYDVDWNHYVFEMSTIIEKERYAYSLAVSQEEINSAENMDVIFHNFLERAAFNLGLEV